MYKINDIIDQRKNRHSLIFLIPTGLWISRAKDLFQFSRKRKYDILFIKSSTYSFCTFIMRMSSIIISSKADQLDTISASCLLLHIKDLNYQCRIEWLVCSTSINYN